MKIEINFAALKRTKWQEYLVRFVFGGAVTTVAAMIAKHFGPGVGGLFLAAPAIFPAAATLVEKHEEKKAREDAGKERFAHQVAGVDAAGAAMGSIGLMAFAVVVWQLAPDHSVVAVLSVATLAWLAVSLTLWYLRKTVWRSLRIKLKRRADSPTVAGELPQSKNPHL